MVIFAKPFCNSTCKISPTVIPATWTRLRWLRPEASWKMAKTVIACREESPPLRTKVKNTNRATADAITSSPTRTGVKNFFISSFQTRSEETA